MLRSTFLLFAVLAALMGAAGTASAAPPAFGGLTPFPTPGGCFASTGQGGCQTDGRVGSGSEVVVTEKTVYVGANNVLAFQRNADGSLGTMIDCISEGIANICDTVDDRIFSIGGMVVDEDTKTLYIGTGNAASNSGVLAYRLNEDGTIGGRISCISQTAFAGCAQMGAMDDVEDVAVSTDRNELYVASKGTAGGIASFALNADGSIASRTGCKTQTAVAGCETFTLSFAYSIAVRGDTAYAAWWGSGGSDSGVTAWDLEATGALASLRNCVRDTSGADEPNCPTEHQGLTFPKTVEAAGTAGPIVVGTGEGVVAFQPTDTGALGAVTGCLTDPTVPATPGCTHVSGLEQTVQSLAFSADGKTTYAAAREDGIYALANDAATGAPTTFVNCARGDGTDGCVASPGMGNVYAVGAARDGLAVYGASQSPSSILSLEREVAPACEGTSGTAQSPQETVLVPACIDANGDPLTIEIVGKPSEGHAYVDKDGKLRYVPFVTSDGTITFTYRATDGTLASAPATAMITVKPGPVETCCKRLDETKQPEKPKEKTTNSGPIVFDPPLRFSPRSTIDRIKNGVRARKLKKLSGRASDRDGRVVRVDVSIVRCKRGVCAPRKWVRAKGTSRWTVALKRRLAKGRYVVYVRATDDAGRVETGFRLADGNVRTFRVR